jgi:hypothetical protein
LPQRNIHGVAALIVIDAHRVVERFLRACRGKHHDLGGGHGRHSPEDG